MTTNRNIGDGWSIRMTMIIMLVHHGMVGIERTSTITSAMWTTGIVRFATGVEVIKARPARSNLYNHF
jgi:hypothetical protein